MASGSKIFTAVGILRLVESGLISLDAKANEIINPYHIDDGITILHLLTHTSGVPDYFNEETQSKPFCAWITFSLLKQRLRFIGLHYGKNFRKKVR